MKKKLLTLLLSAALACSVFAGCGSDSSKESDKKTEASSDKKDTTDTKKDASEEEETILESEVDEADSELADMDNAAVTGKFSDMEAYVNDPTVKASLDQLVDAMQGSGMNMEILGEGDTLTYKYTNSTQVVGDTTSLEDAKSALETAMDAQKTTMQGVADGLAPYVEVSPVKVRAEYYDADGTLIYEAEFVSAN